MSAVKLENHTGLPHLLYEKTTPDGVPMDILVIRGTFDFAPEQPMTLSELQSEIVWGDRFGGPAANFPLQAVIVEEGDLVLGKPGTDVLLQGSLRSPEGHWRPSWLAEVHVGPVRKTLRVCGPRTLTKGFLGWTLSEPEKVEKVALSYRLAFGGCVYDPEPDLAQIPNVSYPNNPAGCGWLPNSIELNIFEASVRERVEAQVAQIVTLPAPQIEDPLNPYSDPTQRLQPVGLTPIPRWWQPRSTFQGTLDARWMAERYPRLPEDFDPRFYQSAPTDQVATPFLIGDEPVHLKGCLREGEYRMRLPGVAPLLVCESTDGQYHVSVPVLDTVRLDLDQRQAFLLWRLPVTAGISKITMALVGTDALPCKASA
ncbi:DUF2169 family type VI secretion system accessory protein [Pseudomonas sp. Ant30-3]|uniref:DUF2169 family type VI secretion system accessory protein n=1 Tax=Pseudomonas sp. Ant30-3 TaxID=1488328 RepID=UPI000491DA35|nr:DUF2169 domain-containing protein [Pseudomonas sp. Ant30-3]